MAAGDDILAVGDLHGRYDLLEQVLDRLAPRFGSQTRLVFLGDYIDRGPDSRRVVERLIALGRERPETVFLKGNHEELLLDALEGRRVELWLLNGGLETLASYGLDHQAPTAETIARLPADHLEFFRGLRLYFESQSYLLVHAGVDPGLGLAEQDARDLLWIREHFHQARGHRLGKTVVFGHTPFPRPFRGPGMIGIDTGAVYDNALTCVKLPEEEFHQLPAQP
jgi:serine/threonine protein phosphatase 1